jgi:hypothetical protein
VKGEAAARTFSPILGKCVFSDLGKNQPEAAARAFPPPRFGERDTGGDDVAKRDIG